jgi:DNA-binding response OmpR family regulator
MSASDPTVVVVDDEPDVADAYAAQLEQEFDIITAYGGEEALEAIDETVEVVLLDRRMPELSGDDVLDAIRDRDLDVRVAMVTAVDPDFDIIEMPFDDYVIKPVSREELFETIDRLLTRATYEQKTQEFYSLSSKQATLRANKSEAELEDSEAFEELERETERLRDELDDTVEEFDEDDFAAAFRDI